MPYTSPIDGNVHRYFVDFWVKVKDSLGDVTTYLVEIKPNVQCKPQKRKPTPSTKPSGRRQPSMPSAEVGGLSCSTKMRSGSSEKLYVTI